MPIINAGINTGFEQYKDIFASLGLDFSFDDWTDGSTSESLKNKAENFLKLLEDTVLDTIKGIEPLCQQVINCSF